MDRNSELSQLDCYNWNAASNKRTSACELYEFRNAKHFVKCLVQTVILVQDTYRQRQYEAFRDWRNLWDSSFRFDRCYWEWWQWRSSARC
jgi:hypothetical protein